MSYHHFFQRLYFYLKPHIGKIFITILSVIFASLLTASLPEVTGQMVDYLFPKNPAEQNIKQALFYPLAILAISLFTTLFTLIYTASNSWVSNQVIVSIRKDMFAKLLMLPKAYFDQTTSGKTLSKLTYDVEQISSAASTIWVNFARASVMVISLMAYLFYKNWQLSLLLIVLIPIIALSIKFSATKMRVANIRVQKSMAQVTHTLNENITGSSLIKLYNAQEQEKIKFLQLSTNIRQQRFKADMSNAVNAAIASVGIGATLSFVAFFANTFSSAGEFFAFFTAMTILVKPVKQLISINKPLQQALAASQSVFSLIDEATEPNQGTQQLNNLVGNIEFKAVNFAYHTKQVVLDKLNLTIKAGQTVALVGQTGSGKSTIVELLCRLYKPISGSIHLDGIDINEVEINHFRHHIALVDQQVYLFNGSIAQNISLGNPEMSMDTIKNAAKLACATSFINNLPQGFDAQIGDNGIQLSGGQRQRLAIARAIAKQSAILIFDEATSALDNKTEQQLQQSIDNIQGKQTLIIIAHRLSTVQKADKIIVLDKGRIAEQGTHKDLLSNGGIYCNLYKKLD